MGSLSNSENYMSSCMTNGSVQISDRQEVAKEVGETLSQEGSKSESLELNYKGNSDVSEKDELLNYLGLKPVEHEEVEDADDDDIDITGLFPDRILEFIRNDHDLYTVYKSFFTESENNSSQGNHDMKANDEDSSLTTSNKRRARQEPFGEKKFPPKKARNCSEERLSRDGRNGSKPDDKL